MTQNEKLDKICSLRSQLKSWEFEGPFGYILRKIGAYKSPNISVCFRDMTPGRYSGPSPYNHTSQKEGWCNLDVDIIKFAHEAWLNKRKEEKKKVNNELNALLTSLNLKPEYY